MKYREYEPKKCWVGEGQKICYVTREEAEVAARVAEHDHKAPHLSVYRCEFCNMWHLSSRWTSIGGFGNFGNFFDFCFDCCFAETFTTAFDFQFDGF